MKELKKKRILTGDTPTGKLHLGHWVGSLENRVALQDSHECFFIVANMQAFSTNSKDSQQIRTNIEQVILDYLAAGINPEKSHIFLQSEVPAIAELSFLFSMLVPLPRVLRNPTIKKEINDKNLGDSYPFGLLFYPISQAADILAIKADVVPVGEDQAPHLELTREVARTFNQVYCGVDPHLNDDMHVTLGGLFKIPEIMLGRVKRLVGTGPPGKDGQLPKMSKSLKNAIFLSDDADLVKNKIMQMYTDPKRLRTTDPGTVENNPLWIFHKAFNTDLKWVEEAEHRYREGTIGDVECKQKLVEVINDFLTPFRIRRAKYIKDFSLIKDCLLKGTEKANAIAEDTLSLVKNKINQDFFRRNLTLKV